MRTLRRLVDAILAWPTWVWLAGLGVVLFIRFPVKFFFFESSPYLMDFEVFRAVAQRVVAGDAPHLYESVGTAQMMFKYAPCWMLLFAPIAWFPWRVALALCSVLTVGWLVVTCWLSDRLCRLIGLHPAGCLGVVAVSILVRPITSEFLLGQTNLLWGCLITGFVFCQARRQPWPAAICLALAISLKVPAALFLCYLMIRRRWDVVWRTSVVALATNLAAACWLSPANPLGLFTAWIRILRISGPDRAFEIGNQSFLALMGRLLRHDGYALNVLTLPDSAVAVVAGVLECLLFLALFSRRVRQLPDTTRLVVDSALVSVLMVLDSPTCWIATYNTTLFATLLASGLLLEHPSQAWRRPALAIGAAGILIFSAMTHATWWHALGVHAVRTESYIYLVLMVFPLFGLSLAWTLWHQRRYLT